MKRGSGWAAMIGGMFWLVKGATILLLGFQPPLLFEIAPLFFAVGLWGVYGAIQDGRSSLLSKLALLLAGGAGLSAVVITLATWFAPHQLPDGANLTVLTPFFVISGLGILLALLLLGIAARQTQTGWSQLLLIMAVGFPLLLGFLGMIGEWMGNDRLIEIPIVLMGITWIQIGFRLKS